MDTKRPQRMTVEKLEAKIKKLDAEQQQAWNEWRSAKPETD